MPEPEIIDVHVHMSRSVAQDKLVRPKPGFPDEWYWANPEHLETHLDNEGIEAIFAINYMTTHQMIRGRLAKMDPAQAKKPDVVHEVEEEMKERVDRYNDWVCEYGAGQTRAVPFVCVDIGLYNYDQDAMMQAAETYIAAGARGFKIHPGLSEFLPGDQRMLPLYERLQAAGIPVLADSGGSGPARKDGVVYGEPNNFAPVFENFPRLRFIMAHLCSEYWDEREFIADRFPQVYFDTAGGFYAEGVRARGGHRACAVEDGARLLRRIGTHRVMFGSDGPGADQRAQFRQILALPLTDDERRQVLAGNAREFIGL